MLLTSSVETVESQAASVPSQRVTVTGKFSTTRTVTVLQPSGRFRRRGPGTFCRGTQARDPATLWLSGPQPGLFLGPPVLLGTCRRAASDPWAFGDHDASAPAGLGLRLVRARSKPPACTSGVSRVRFLR